MRMKFDIKGYAWDSVSFDDVEWVMSIPMQPDYGLSDFGTALKNFMYSPTEENALELLRVDVGDEDEAWISYSSFKFIKNPTQTVINYYNLVKA
jgi:hypothetical protein